MRKLLFILSALILTGGGLSAQSHGHRQHALKENGAKGATELRESPKENPRIKALKQRAENRKAKPAKSGNSIFKANASKDGGPVDYLLSVIPGPENPYITFSFDDCGQTQTKQLVVKNTTDEPVDAILISEYPNVDLKRVVFDGWLEDVSVVNGYLYGWSYNYDEEEYEEVKINLETGVVEVISGEFWDFTTCGGTIWAASWGDEFSIVALDDNLEPTGFSFTVDEDNWFHYGRVSSDGENLLVYGYNYNVKKFRVKAYNTSGELVADYGEFDTPNTGSFVCDPATRTFWIASGEFILGIQINNGKYEVADIVSPYYMEDNWLTYMAFGENGECYYSIYSYEIDREYIMEGSRMQPFGKGVSLSPAKLSLQPGEQTTVNITANASAGSNMAIIGAVSSDFYISSDFYFMRAIATQVNVEPEFEVYGDTVMTTFAGNEITGNVWLKNTGCQSIEFDDISLKYYTYFNIQKPLLPPFFNGTINPGDSVGYAIGFDSESAGNFTDTLAFFIIKDETPSPILVPLKGICEDVDYTIAKTEFDMEITECVETLAIDDTITNNTNLPMTVAIDNVKFKIHTGWDEECSMAWDLKDAHNNIIYSWPEDGFEYDSDYERDFLLPEGDYTLKLYGGGEFGWGSNCIDLTVNGKRLLSQASWSSSFNQFKFTAKEAWSTEVPAKSSLESIDVPLGLLTMPGYNYLKLIAQGVPDPVDTITLYTYGGQPDFSVVSSYDFGKVSEYGQSTLVLTNNGCAPVSFKDVVFKYWNAGHRDYFKVWNEEAGEEKPYAGLDEIAPYSSVELPIYVYVDSIGEFRDTLLFSVEGQGKFEVVMTATGVGAPEASFADTVIKDTVAYGTESITVSKMVVNNGGSDLIITHPISISYNSGSMEYWNWFQLYSLTPYFAYDLYSFGDSWDVNKNYNLEPGDYALVLDDWDDSPETQDAYFTITNGGNTIVGKTMLKDLRMSQVVGDFWGYRVKFTLTEDMLYRDTIAPGDSMLLTMEIPLHNWYAGYYDVYDADEPLFSKTFYTNDPQNQEITLTAEVCVEGEMNIAVPKTIELGNVQVGTYGKQTITITNTGGVPFDLYDIYITGAGSSSFDFTFTGDAFWPNWGEDLTIKFTPTATGLAEAQIAFVGQDSTLTIALKGTGVAPVEPVFSADTVRVTAECGQSEATAKFTVTNNSNSTMVFASHPRVMVYTGDGENPNKLRFSVWRLNEQGNAAVQCLLNKNAGFFTESGKTMEFELDLPVGHYKAVIEGNNGNTDRNTNATVEVVYNGEPLGYTRSVATNYYVDYFHVTESMNEITEVAANSTKELEFTYSLEGLTPGEYVYTKILDHNSVEPASDTLVTVVTIESKLDYAYSKDTVEFVPVHVGNDSYATVKIENTGCEDVEIVFGNPGDFGFIDGTNFMATIGLRVASYMPAPLLNPADLNLEVGEVTPIYLVFTAERPGTYRDTLIITTSRGIDTIPVVATATATQVLEVSTPTADGYYRAGDTLAINVIFDALVDLDSTSSTGLPQLLMNTGGYAVLDTTYSDGYTLRFLYPIAETDNIEKLAIEAIEWNGVKVMDGETEITVNALPANNEFAGSEITLDNTAPTFAVSTSAAATSATLTVVFSEEITGFESSDITLSNDANIEFSTDDNKTFVAEFTLPHAVTTNISIDTEVADLAGNVAQFTWTGSVVTAHDFDTTVVEPTFDNVGYKKLVCKICGETVYIDTVPVLEVKVVSIALTKLPKKLNYAAGEAIDLSGAQLTLTFNNGETKVIDLTLAMISGFDINATGKQTITVKYADGGETFTATFDIEIKKAEEGSAVAEEAAAAVSIYSFDNTIVVEAEADGSEIAVFDLNGRMVAKALATGSRTEIEMSVAGIYVVRVGNTAERVAVK